jgi:16S rRNA processing protein RimM
MTKAPEQDLLAVAKLGAPRGLKGLLKLHSYSGEFGHLAALKTVLAAPENKPEQAKLLRIVSTESGEWGMSAAFEGYETPEKARALTGLELFLPRENVSPLQLNEYYIHDLVGLKLIFGDAELGEVEGVLDGGADPLLEVRRGASGATFLVPFRSEFIGEVDCEAGTMELLAGWLLE